MRFSMTAIFFIISILILSIFVANLANIISTDKELIDKLNKSVDNSWTKSQRLLHLDDNENHLMWFMQISDIHISMFSDEQRIKQFESFAKETVDIVKPKVVLASGDLTDARIGMTLGSKQLKTEWEIYRNVLDRADISNKTAWLDIRGNHDTFGVPLGSPKNFFNSHSIQGARNPRSYLYQVEVGNEKYSFIAVDACLEPGLIRQLNFLGLLDVNETSHIIDLNKKARELGGNYTIWFGHYPTSCILSPGTGKGGLRGIIGQYDESYAYLCGHLHTQGGLVPHMYTFQKAGFLELELGDWKTNRLFRVLAFDHGLLSFVDVHHGEWPIVLVTNPKHALFNIPNRESPELQIKSTHIRILIFTPSKVSYCAINISDGEWKSCKQVTENLFVVPWIPEKYAEGVYNLEVIVHTDDGRTKNINQPFCLDGSRLSFDLMARFVLMTDICQLFQAMFGVSLALCVVPLCVLRILHELVLAGKCCRPRLRRTPFRHCIRRLWILSTVDRVFIPLLCFFVYIAAGPWAISEVVEGHYGVIFIWGIFVNNAFLPGSLTYIYACFQLLFCQLPLIFIYANLLYDAFLRFTNIDQGKRRLNGKCRHLAFGIIMTIEIGLAIFYLWTHGFVAFLLGSIRTWSIIFNIILWCVARNVPESSLSSAINVWNN